MVYDVVVLGGGPAGSVASMQLQDEGYNVLMLEADTFQRHRVGETFSPIFIETLGLIGLKDAFLAQDYLTTFGFGSAWGTDKLEFSSHISTPYGQGWHVDRAKFDHMLFQQACWKGVDGILGCRISTPKVVDTDSRWLIQWTDNSEQKEATGRFLLNACGRKNLFHKRMKDELAIYDDLVAVAWLIPNHRYSPEAAMIESVEIGWWYSSPLPSGKAIVMLMTDFDLVISLRLKKFDNWYAQLQKAKHTFDRLPKLGTDKPKKLFVKFAHSQRVTKVKALNYLPIGDALASFDPINGAGIVRTMQTSIGGARVVKRHLDGDQSAIDELLTGLEVLYDGYLNEKAAHYAMEKRWSDSVFWQRRSSIEGFHNNSPDSFSGM